MDYEKIGRFIYELRKNKGLTQKDLAEKLSVTIQAISKWERGLGCPDVSLLRPLSLELDVSISEILNGEKIKKENVLEKVDDILMKNLEENEKRRKNDRIIFLSFVFTLILIFVSFSINVYSSIRIILVLLIILVAVYIPVVVNKKVKLWHIFIPIFIFSGLILFDYIAVKYYHRQPIFYYNIDVLPGNLEIYRRYDSLLYRAYQCSENEIYEIDNRKESPDSYCKSRYDYTFIKSASITSKEGYVYFLGIYTSFNKNYKGQNYYFLEGFDLGNIFESSYIMEQLNILKGMNKEQIQELYNDKSYDEILESINTLKPHGDNDLSYAPDSVYDDLVNLNIFLNQKRYNKVISINDLGDLNLKVLTKEEVVKLFNKVIDDGNDGINYEIKHKTKTIDNIDYEIVYMLESNKITHVKINLKNMNNIDTLYLKKIEDLIVSENTFNIKDKIEIKKRLYRNI